MYFLNILFHINITFCITKIKILAIIQKFDKIFKVWVMPKLLRCMPSFPTCFLESRDFCHVNLIVSSSLQKFPTMLFALDPLLARLYLQVMIFKITSSFVVDLTLLVSWIIFSATTSRDSSILRLFVPQCIVIPSGLKYRYDLKCHYSIIVRASWKTNLKSGKKLQFWKQNSDSGNKEKNGPNGLW